MQKKMTAAKPKEKVTLKSKRLVATSRTRSPVEQHQLASRKVAAVRVVPVPPAAPALVSVMPKVDVEPVVLSVYFAVEIRPRESYRDVAQAVLAAADALAIHFRKLEVLEVMTIGTTHFVRFRSDACDIERVLCRLAARARVVPDGGGYMVRMSDGRTAKCPNTVMNANSKPGFGRMFAGTKIANWSKQFAPAAT